MPRPKRIARADSAALALLREIVEGHQRRLDRALRAEKGVVSDDEIDLLKIAVAEAQLRVAEAEGS